MDFSNLRDLRGVDAISTVKIKLDDVVKIASGGFDGCLQIFEDLFDLGSKVVFATKISLRDRARPARRCKPEFRRGQQRPGSSPRSVSPLYRD